MGMDKNITNRTQKKAIVVIKGGFGNQLFQFAYANYLKSLNFKVSLNLDFFKKQDSFSTPREIVLPIRYFNLKETTIFEKFYQRLVKKFFNTKSINYFKTFKGYEANLDETVKNNIFDGYWKRLEYLESQKKYLVSSLRKNQILNDSFDREINPDSTAIHIRRGDFIENDWDLNVEFYEEAIKYLNNKINNFTFDIFTDDPEWVQSQDIFKNVNTIFSQKTNTVTETIETFGRLMNYQNTVIGNSTFSFLSAFLKSSENEIVITADPWYKNSEHPTLAKTYWIKIKNA